jgi:formylglycine-generating enzyme required for sulfatase activity
MKPPRGLLPFVSIIALLVIWPAELPGAGTVNSVGMTMVSIPAGSFKMGQDKRNTDYRWHCSLEIDQGADWDELPTRQVEITKPFAISAAEVSNAQYEMFEPNHRAARRMSKKISKEDDAAVVNVSWEDAARYCQWLSRKEKKHYRLPTEAEWEYACRAGTTTCYHYGDVLPDKYQPMNADFLVQMDLYIPERKKAPPYYAFLDKISLLRMQHPPNAWGLYDMHGNAQEWCLDWYAPYNADDTKDPLGKAGNSRVIRGGAFSCWGRLLRSANRSSMLPGMRTVQTGFRVVAGADLGQIEKIVPVPEFAAAKAVKPYIDPSYDPKRPLFEGPTQYVKIPPNSLGPLYSAHNHDSGVACMPNGDVLAVFYSTVLEGGCELAVASSRLKAGSKEWMPAEPFFDTADMNDHAPAIFVDGNTVYHFNLSGTWKGSFVRTSTDNGYTWTQFRPYCQEDPAGQPNESTIKTHDGRLLGTLDGPNETSEVVESSDHGNTWKMLTRLDDGEHETPGRTGKAIAGIHTAMVELCNGDLLAFGRVDKTRRLVAYRYKLPQSLSKDGGKTWTYSVSEFPAVTSGQRMTMKRLKEGPILLSSFSDRLLREKAEEIGKVGLNTVANLKSAVRRESERDGIVVCDGKGGESKGFGLFAALSWDDGKTWPVKRLIVPKKLPARIEGTDGGLQRIDAAHAEPNGYLAMAQGADGRIHLHSSRNDYLFNLAWLTAGTLHADIPRAGKSTE